MQMEKDLERKIIDAGIAYTLYSAALVNYAIDLNKNSINTHAQQEMIDYAFKLKNALFRCKIDIDIPDKMTDPNKILSFLQSQELLLEISSKITREYSSRQEDMFIFITLLGGIIYGKTGGLKNQISSIIPIINKFAIKLEIPENIIKQCISNESLDKLYEFLRQQEINIKDVKSENKQEKVKFINTLTALLMLIVSFGLIVSTVLLFAFFNINIMFFIIVIVSEILLIPTIWTWVVSPPMISENNALKSFDRILNSLNIFKYLIDGFKNFFPKQK